jgi:VanZ family protein
MKNFEHFVRFQLPAIAWAICIFLLSSIPGSKLPAITHFVNDKILHATEYFVFGSLIYRALEPRKDKNKFSWVRLIIPVGIIIVFGLSDEYHQSFVAGRTEDLLDAVADTIGGLLSAGVMYIVERRRSYRPNDI